MPAADMREGAREKEGDEKGITELATLFNQRALGLLGLLARSLARSPPDSLA